MSIDNTNLFVGAAFIVVLGLVIILAIEASNQRYPVPQPLPPDNMPGCAETRWGCCPDGRTTKMDPLGSNCFSRPPLIGGCAGTRWGCCPDGRTAKRSPWDTC